MAQYLASRLVLTFALLIVSCREPLRYAFVKSATGLPLRDNPSFETSQILETIPPMQEVQVLRMDGPIGNWNSLSGPWYFVQYLNTRGWSFSPFLQLSEPAETFCSVLLENMKTRGVPYALSLIGGGDFMGQALRFAPDGTINQIGHPGGWGSSTPPPPDWDSGITPLAKLSSVSGHLSLVPIAHTSIGNISLKEPIILYSFLCEQSVGSQPDITQIALFVNDKERTLAGLFAHGSVANACQKLDFHSGMITPCD